MIKNLIKRILKSYEEYALMVANSYNYRHRS